MGNGLKEMEKFISPILDRNRELENFRNLSTAEKAQILKQEMNLTHGCKKSKKKKKR